MRTSRHCKRLPPLVRPSAPQGTVPDFIATSMVPARSGLADKATVDRMASDMREAAYREGGMTRAGLELLGYTALQIDRHAPAARIKADQLAGMT